jgi:cytoskeleton protein RodZ
MGQAGTSDDQVTSEQGTRISVGLELRRAREVRHVSLAQLSAETRIALRHLEALEEDRFDDLPGRLYARNFVRQVARSLGADEQELLDYFDYQSGELARVAGQGEEALSRRSSGRRLAFGALAVAGLVIAGTLGFALTRDDATGAPEGGPAPDENRAAPSESIAGGLPSPAAPEAEPVAAAAGSAQSQAAGPARPAPAEARAAELAPEKPKPEAATPQPKPQRAEAEPARPSPAAAMSSGAPERRPEPESPAALAGAAPEPEAEPAPAEPVPPRVRLVFNGPSWIEVVPEGSGNQIMGLKTAGQEVSFPLSSPVELTVANAGNVELFIDGRPARALGAPGERRTLRLDADTWQTYLR